MQPICKISSDPVVKTGKDGGGMSSEEGSENKFDKESGEEND